MISFPKQPNQYSAPIWNQKNDSDMNGSLWATTGIDLSENEGKIRLGKRTIFATGKIDDADMNNIPSAFKIFTDNSSNQYNWTIMGSYIWKGFGQSTTTAVKDAHTSLPAIDSTLSDMEVFNGELYVVNSSGNLNYLTSSSAAWTAVALGLSVAGGNSLCGFQNVLYASGGTTVFSMTTGHAPSTSGAYTITALPDSGLAITFIRAGQNKIWIGTVHTNGGKAYIYEWDGVATQVTKGYRLESSGALACVIKDDVPYVMDSNGKLLVWNGGTFIELAKLNRRRNYLLKNSNALTDRFIHKNGMSLVNGRINLLIRGVNGDAATVEETIPSGIWEYDANRGLTHKHSISTAKFEGPIQDYGQTNISSVGALSEYTKGGGSSFFAGVNYFSDATTVKSGIFYNDINDVLQKAGSIITTKQYAIDQNGQPSVQNSWQNFYTLNRKLLDSADKIEIKYRVVEIEPTIATITWVSSSSFTVSASLVDISKYWNFTSGIGGEVEIINGIGAGKCSHITNAINAAGTWTVTVDETYIGATGTAIARFQLWKKISTINYNNSTPNGVGFDQAGMGDVSNWVQIKLWMLFTGRDEIEKLIIINQNYNPAN